jgi:hypothetical protein
MDTLGAFLAKHGLRHEKMLRKRLNDGSSSDRVVDRIRVDVSIGRWKELTANGSLKRMQAEASEGVRAILAWLMPISTSN